MQSKLLIPLSLAGAFSTMMMLSSCGTAVDLSRDTSSVPTATAITANGSPIATASVSKSETITGPAAPADYEQRTRPVSEQDLRILQRADELLRDESVWNRNDDRVCPDDEAAGKRSLFCALQKACIDVLGTYDHRRVALQEVRFAVEDATKGQKFDHRLRDFNNLPETRFSDIKEALATAMKRVRGRLATAP